MDIQQEAKQMKKLVRLADYLAAAQVFLRDNFLLHEPLKHEHIKHRILGHWGTVPGITLVQANINRLINKYGDKDFLYIVGPGHGFPGYHAHLFIEGSFDGTVAEMIGNFSTPYGYPSHLNPNSRGVILEGGELGYSLSVATGTVMDNPDLITVCLVGDGEAETGPLAAAWNVNRFINPVHDGVVLPVLHLNGYKISGPTVFGRMSDDEVRDFFTGHGYAPLFVDAQKEQDLTEQSIEAFDRAMQMIALLRTQAQSDEGLVAPRWPVIILRTPKGMGAPEEVDGVKVEGNYASHQVVFGKLKSDKPEDAKERDTELKQLEQWLRSYKIEELITNYAAASGGDIPLEYDEDILALIPKDGRKLGDSPYAHGERRGDLALPDPGELVVELVQRGQVMPEGEMHIAGKYMRALFEHSAQERNFRLFSPDETYSNRLMAVFEQTARAWQWPILPHDKDMAQDGRVVELLSEHTLFGMLMGYTLTGRYGFFVTYEAFGHIVSSMFAQYVKFLSVARNVPWRKPMAPLNIILTSLIERQDHNGFSHQNPSFATTALDHNQDIVNVYYPADHNLMLEAMDASLSSSDSVNVIVVGKKMYRAWLTADEARKQAEDGAMIWDFLSNDGEPDVVLATAGDYVTEEAVIGLTLFRKFFPEVRVRFVNFFKLDMLVEHSEYAMDAQQLDDKYFTNDKPIVFNFHGYRTTIKKLLFDYNVSDRIIINGYDEQGSTTSPFDMFARNGLSRYHLVADLAEQAWRAGVLTQSQAQQAKEEMQRKLKEEKEYIIKHKIDPPEITNW